jgi:1,4-alpha-glucan branching enzyme
MKTPATVLTASEKDAIVEGLLSDPFELLGMHPLGDLRQGRLEIRTFCPAASSVTAVTDSGSEMPMSRIRPEGLFVWQSPPRTDPFPYELRVHADDGSSWTTPDPYSFPPQLGEIDLHLFAEGRHHELYDRFGARLWSAEDVDGVLFSVWAPNAAAVSVTGSFNDWDRRRHPMRSRGGSGVWELFIPGIRPGDLYKFSIRTADGSVIEKADPLALRSEFRPSTASVVEDLAHFQWTDGDWMTARASMDPVSSRISIYEVHAASFWRPEDFRRFPSWNELGDRLIPWATGLGFTHIELLPVMEHPFDGSWGYQTTGYFSPTSRLGSPGDFQRFVDRCHAAGLGVILDWAPAHFPADPSGLASFDGTCLYEHADPRKGFHPDWSTLVFNYDRNEVRNFLVASALFWLDRYHVDGIRVDAVASMLYLDYSRAPGEWIPNSSGGRENLGAIEFMRELNSCIARLFPGAMSFAEESTSWPGVTSPPGDGGLGFTFKWNMGWMNDTVRFFAREPVHRKHHIGELTFSFLYAFSERFILPLSHDEVVHGKSSLVGKMPGDIWRKRANLRLLLAYQWAHPGKKLLFMGGELAQWNEWDHESTLRMDLLEHDGHRGIADFVRDLNRTAGAAPALYRMDASHEGFTWVDFRDSDATVISFRRMAPGERDVLCVFNLTPVVREGYRVGVQEPGIYRELLNSDSETYGGSGVGNLGSVTSVPVPMHGLPHSILLRLPPLAALYLGT